jgi:hypothetical protein
MSTFLDHFALLLLAAGLFGIITATFFAAEIFTNYWVDRGDK